jgi:Flp pilus assembly protein protease CpaA
MEILFLVLLAGVWLLIASIQDLKKREVPNWLSFSLIIFALAFRLFYSVLSSDLTFFLYGILGFAIFFLLAYVFYYGRVFAGGDAKLLMGLGAILPLSMFFYSNLLLLASFILILFFVGSIYGMMYSIVMVLGNRGKFYIEFSRQFRRKRDLIWVALVFAVLNLFLVLYMQESILFLFPLIIFVLPFLFIYAKAIEESCMVKEVKGKDVTIGDWLYEPVKIGRKVIMPYWEGVSEEDVRLLKKSRKRIKIKYGIPFVPVFFLAFILLLILRYSFWGFF